VVVGLAFFRRCAEELLSKSLDDLMTWQIAGFGRRAPPWGRRLIDGIDDAGPEWSPLEDGSEMRASG